jgi:hypothetical protein
MKRRGFARQARKQAVASRVGPRRATGCVPLDGWAEIRTDFRGHAVCSTPRTHPPRSNR